MKLRTVRVKAAGGSKLINERDYDPEVHKLAKGESASAGGDDAGQGREAEEKTSKPAKARKRKGKG